MRRDERAFTLIELMIVVAIIGILAAIAIPQFAAYRQRAHDAAAKSALRNLAVAMDIYYSEHQSYTENVDDVAQWYTPEENIRMIILEVDNLSWSAAAQHLASSNIWYYDSLQGGLQTESYGTTIPGWN